MTKTKRTAVKLAKGQLWKLNSAYIKIVELGKMLLDYKMMTQPNQGWVRTQSSSIDTMLGYLESRKAQLVRMDT